MFDDILGNQEVFYEDDENPIEFEYHGGDLRKEEPPDYHGPYDDKDGPMDEKLRQIVRDFIRDNLTDEDEVCCDEGECDGCADAYTGGDSGKDDLLSCRVCRQPVHVPKAVHYRCYGIEKLRKKHGIII